MPQISVIIPIYGVEKYIERCARSLFDQTFQDIEYIFIDDCSPDNSVLILNQVLKEYPNRVNQTIIHRIVVNGNDKCTDFGNRECSDFGNSNAPISVTTIHNFR